jgi:hypothetical protein
MGLTAGIEQTTSEVTGADVNFEHGSYDCATPTAQNLFSGAVSKYMNNLKNCIMN